MARRRCVPEKSEGARFWTSVLTELRNRSVKDVLFVCTDGLSGFPEAIDAVFPQAVNQTCIVHLVRQSLRYLSWRERKRCAGELRRIYTAADADAARQVLDELTAAWSESKTRTAALQVWDSRLGAGHPLPTATRSRSPRSSDWRGRRDRPRPAAAGQAAALLPLPTFPELATPRPSKRVNQAIAARP
jgi:hypothetical protein